MNFRMGLLFSTYFFIILQKKLSKLDATIFGEKNIEDSIAMLYHENSKFNKYKLSNRSYSKLLNVAEEQVLHGSNLIYPEIWMDSEYSKTYSIKMRLVSPYGTREAIYLNIFVPMFHALCLTLPRQTSANSYASPFIIRDGPRQSSEPL